ncbi:MAG TPA: nuclear transport factor 2 family protein [Terriglobales bacterium]|nr:nuclear transport factor 2 family protein [Terriglobales bacterium]
MLRSLLLLVVMPLAADSISAQEIAIVTCDVLPVVEVRVSGLKFHFLVDTAATSVLNIGSFATGEAKTIPLTSWSGTADAKGKQVTINDLSVGDRHFHNLVLPAVDLSGIGRACGRQIDGILGIDLLRKMGAVVDLRDHTPRLRFDAEATQSRLKRLDERIATCEGAFNRQDEAAISDCFDPDVAVFSEAGDFHGREGLMEFFRQWYPSHHWRAQLSAKPSFYHVFGDVIWVEYQFRTNIGDKPAIFRGSALWSNAGGAWRIAHLNLGTPPDFSVTVSNH